jgi:hypothetical protein
MQKEPGSAGSTGITREVVERALADWLDEHGADCTTISPWESHCFALISTFLRHGYHEQALEQLGYILEPPTPLPVFPLRHSMSFEQFLNGLPPGVHGQQQSA